LQSGDEGLGACRHHTRPIADDYKNAVSSDIPTKIIGASFINVGVFGGHNGDAKFANVAIVAIVAVVAVVAVVDGSMHTEVFED
jgi:hypothetical protein